MSAGEDAPAAVRPVPAAVWAEGIFTVGVTGTNGKTSTTLMVADVLRASGLPVAVETTLGSGTAPGKFTSRGENAFFERMHRVAEQGITRCAVEVTSEALASGWAKKWRFDLGVFTNLSQDHLDAHGSYEHYLASKAQLFVHLGPGCHAILNAADETSLLLDRVIPADVVRSWYASPNRGPALVPADLASERLELTLDGTEILLAPSPLAELLNCRLHTPLVGAVFAENALAAACTGLRVGLTPVQIQAGLSALRNVPGRFEIVSHSPVVAVDYAHTPDALARTCDAARDLARQLGQSRVIIVFGAGGNRDKTKRRPMGEAVGSRADYAIITSDNPRDENPKEIARPVENGCRRGGRAHVIVELDRARAVARALDTARANDVIVICGKGHETGQTIGKLTLPFDDAQVARQLISGRRNGQ